MAAVICGATSRTITDYRLTQTRSISAGEMYSKICVEWVADHFGFDLT